MGGAVKRAGVRPRVALRLQAAFRLRAADGWARRGPACSEGSILILVLFACLAVAVVVQTLTTVALCAERAALDEATGRQRLAEKDAALVALRKHALTAWEEAPDVDLGPELGQVQGSLTRLDPANDWILQAAARQEASLSRLVTSAWVERGRDGIDLPLAAVVATKVITAPDREPPCIEAEPQAPDEGAIAKVFVRELPAGAAVAAGCSLLSLGQIWRLDAGWCVLSGAADPEGLAAGCRVLIFTGDRIQQVHLPADSGGLQADAPCLVVVTGGADLEAEGRGDLYAVLVVDDGSVSLEGTVLHGAVFVSDTVDLGSTGRVVFSRQILRWATDRSLVRSRLIPGSRSEWAE